MDGLKGMAIQPGMNVYHIAGMSNLWLDVEVFESQLAWVEVGSRAKVTFPYFPAREFRGRVRFVEPGVSDKTRTVKVTLKVPNPDGKLRAGMYATAEFNPVLAGSAVTIPSTSVLRTGQRNVVVVALGNGRFLPRNVDLGSEGDGYVQVLSGIQPGEEVVTSAQFLIDSESNLQAAITKMAHSEKQS
jgi:Cu(I)/Ag(I) efflux system membrane fusion protein